MSVVTKNQAANQIEFSMPLHYRALHEGGAPPNRWAPPKQVTNSTY